MIPVSSQLVYGSLGSINSSSSHVLSHRENPLKLRKYVTRVLLDNPIANVLEYTRGEKWQ